MLTGATLRFLGTGTSQGIPVIGSDHPVCLSSDPRDKRLRTSALLRWGGYNFVIDSGPDFRQQLLAADCRRLDGILLTHEHNDHMAGLDDIRPFFFNQGNIPIYALQRVLDALTRRFDYIFSEKNKYPGAPGVDSIPISKEKPIALGGKTVIPIEVLHGQLPVLGFRVGDFTYITDAKTVSPEELKKIKGSRVLVVNALRQAPHHSHFNLEEALAFIEQVRPERAYLTHISHLLGFHREVQQSLPNGVFLAYDGLEVGL